MVQTNCRYIIGFVGLIVQRKGFDLICDIFPEICEEFPKSVLWVVGPKNHTESNHIHDDEVARYQAVLEPVKSHVKFFGNIQERNRLAELMAAMDIFVFPTRQEGFGLAPVEAMACGVPPIVARIPGVTDLANIEGITGKYIEPDNREQLKQAVRALILDQELRQRMGKAARKRVEENFPGRVI
jgi:starch synthase